MASLWSLNKAQRELTAVGKELGVRIRYFHGPRRDDKSRGWTNAPFHRRTTGRNHRQ